MIKRKIDPELGVMIRESGTRQDNDAPTKDTPVQVEIRNLLADLEKKGNVPIQD